MEIADTTKFAIGALFLVVGIGLLLVSRRERGFGQRKQAGVLMLLGGGALVAVGLGLIESPW